MENKINKLFIVGDSYSMTYYGDSNDRVWTKLLSQKLNCQLINNSCPGSSQDWAMNTIVANEDQITSDDQLIIALTEPARVWYVEERPDFSNPWIVDTEFDLLGMPHIKEAIISYVRNIQRPALDTRHVAFRLGWLNNLVKINNWRKPIILLGFPQTIPNLDTHYPDLYFATGSLFEVTKDEEDLNDLPVSVGIDSRYNHLILSNHDILVDKIVDHIENGAVIDLTTGFLKSVISNDLILNEEFAKKELNLEYCDRYKTAEPHREKRTLMHKIFKL